MLVLPDERQAAISQRLVAGGRVVAADLAREFRTSEDTIRRDLRELASAGLCRRVYGGALPVSPASTSIAVRTMQDQARKAALGACAAALVEPGQIVLIDAGSTNLQIARGFPDGFRFTVVTNAPAIAAEMAARPLCDLILLGGRVEQRVGGSIGARAVRDLQSMQLDLCFLGACAADPVNGVTAFDAEEAEFKRLVIERSERTVIALTNAKLSTVAPFGVASLVDVDDIVIEADAPGSRLEGFTAGGPRLHRAAEPRP